jgi:A/G-specific adenine glycosylase
MRINSAELIGWYDVAQRDLPWRRPDVTAWQILVSEFMLQQTPVSRVEPIWQAWVQRWPTPSATAAASVADVLRAWGKLGYPRRAKRLHECATVITRDHDDVVPDEVETLLSLPGVGHYTARASTPTYAEWSHGRFEGLPMRRPALETSPTSPTCCRKAKPQHAFR